MLCMFGSSITFIGQLPIPLFLLGRIYSIKNTSKIAVNDGHHHLYPYTKVFSIFEHKNYQHSSQSFTTLRMKYLPRISLHEYLNVNWQQTKNQQIATQLASLPQYLLSQLHKTLSLPSSDYPFIEVCVMLCS